jgi:hypothetical protein
VHSPDDSVAPLLDWMRELAAQLGIHVYIETTTLGIAEVQPGVLRDFQVLASEELAQLTRFPGFVSFYIVLRHIPAGTALSPADGSTFEQLAPVDLGAIEALVRLRDIE